MNWQKQELETVACDLCGSTDQKFVIVRPDGLAVVECSNCALCYLSPRPNPERVAKLYSADYFKHDAPDHQVGYVNYLADGARRGQRMEARSRFATIKKFYRRKEGRCLEIGCATGEFAALLHNKGWEVTGIDISEEAIRHAKARFHSIDFRCVDVANLDNEEKFDLVCAFEVIEHVLSPGEFLQQAARVLSDEGVLVLSTPNYDCARRLGPESWIGFHTSFEHLYFFSPTTVQKYSDLRGFEAVEWLTDKSTGKYSDSCRQTSDRRSARFSNRVLETLGLLKPARRLKNFLACQCGTNYVPQGLGHNLFVILRKTSLA
jgi:2-polyprenyl-3-methyl-5-hydroxy-6-metoxy-1,4-benzoquinol methylase